ncbi:MAG: outer membrane beta-barrel protein [Bacteroidota bacterium]|nr:outer membrane beta-barrel protein [Bacteroidota bacterium]
MKKTIISLLVITLCLSAAAQIDSSRVTPQDDTIRIGTMIILKKGNPDDHTSDQITLGRFHTRKRSKFKTSSFVLDIGFSNWVDKTDYSAAVADNYLVSRPGQGTLNSSDFNLRTIKSVNINLWFFMQRLSLINHYLNLVYGLGLELNNYRFQSPVSLHKSGFNPYNTGQFIDHPFILQDSVGFRKNKLAADYLTIPLMLDLSSNAHSDYKGIRLSAGVSVGYLYSNRNKQISAARGMQKIRGDLGLQSWKFSYIAEVGLGPVHLYGSYSPQSIFTKGLQFKPYTVGLRFSNW